MKRAPWLYTLMQIALWSIHGVLISYAQRYLAGMGMRDSAIGLLLGGVNFNDRFLILRLPEGVDRAQVTSTAVAAELGVTTFNYGSFLTAVLDFLIMAFVIFLLVKGINKLTSLHKKEEAPKAPTTRVCPYCRSTVDIKATRCPHCTSELPPVEEEPEKAAQTE